MKKTNLVIFASGNGSNAEQIARHFKSNPKIAVAAIFTNNPNAGVLDRAKTLGLPTEVFNKMEFKSPDLLDRVKKYDGRAIVLAGFLWKIPQYMIDAFRDKIINIHPALLPKYGGKGMYGHFVHESVIQNKEKGSGITVHLANKNYDEGKILFQARCEVTEDDGPSSLAKKIRELEHAHYPKAIEEYVTSFFKN